MLPELIIAVGLAYAKYGLGTGKAFYAGSMPSCP
jgi:hypothetical protein